LGKQQQWQDRWGKQETQHHPEPGVPVLGVGDYGSGDPADQSQHEIDRDIQTCRHGSLILICPIFMKRSIGGECHRSQESIALPRFDPGCEAPELCR
jgi:hypothetical protein